MSSRVSSYYLYGQNLSTFVLIDNASRTRRSVVDKPFTMNLGVPRLIPGSSTLSDEIGPCTHPHMALADFGTLNKLTDKASPKKTGLRGLVLSRSV